MASTNLIDTDAWSSRYRAASLDATNGKLLVTNFRGTKQEDDFSEPSNCAGFGRIRHFIRKRSIQWPNNPLPIDPACKALGLPRHDSISAQVFQNAACNWRCWYCFVPFDLLTANRAHSDWLSAEQLVELYVRESNRPCIIDLTGGQPDLVPEWVPWMMKELTRRGLQSQVYLWSDDNLSNDYYWKYLSDADQKVVREYPSYGRVCCFKGFDEESFSFNTRATPSLFERQFELMRRFVDTGMDVYAYVTLTTPRLEACDAGIPEFVDRLQAIHVNLPLRTVPLEIEAFTPVKERLDATNRQALENQHRAAELWLKELDARYPKSLREAPITDIKLHPHK